MEDYGGEGLLKLATRASRSVGIRNRVCIFADIAVRPVMLQACAIFEVRQGLTVPGDEPLTYIQVTTCLSLFVFEIRGMVGFPKPLWLFDSEYTEDSSVFFFWVSLLYVLKFYSIIIPTRTRESLLLPKGMGSRL